MRKPFYFKLQELVCNHCIQKYSEQQLWSFFDEKFLVVIDEIREILGSPMICNDYRHGYTQRGARCNMCEIVKSKTLPYVSAHVLWRAADFTVKGMTAQEARKLIIKNADKLSYPIRLEDGVRWLHVDTYEVPGHKVYLFKV